MKYNIRSRKTWALLGALCLGSLGMVGIADAATFLFQVSLDRNNSAGTTFANLTPSATSFCYLSRVGFTNTDTDVETAECRLTRGSLVWTLEAVLGASSDADAHCSATCYTTN